MLAFSFTGDTVGNAPIEIMKPSSSVHSKVFDSSQESTIESTELASWTNLVANQNDWLRPVSLWGVCVCARAHIGMSTHACVCFTGVHVHSGSYMWGYVCICACGGQRTTEHSFHAYPPHLFETGSLIGLELSNLAKVTIEPRGLSHLAFPT